MPLYSGWVVSPTVSEPACSKFAGDGVRQLVLSKLKRCRVQGGSVIQHSTGAISRTTDGAEPSASDSAGDICTSSKTSVASILALCGLCHPNTRRTDCKVLHGSVTSIAVACPSGKTSLNGRSCCACSGTSNTHPKQPPRSEADRNAAGVYQHIGERSACSAAKSLCAILRCSDAVERLKGNRAGPFRIGRALKGNFRCCACCGHGHFTVQLACEHVVP
jgi:hypothetical protein